MPDYTDTRCPSIQLASLETALAGVQALALCTPPDGKARPLTAEDFPPVTSGPATPAPAVGLPISRNPVARMEGRGRVPTAAAVQPGPVPTLPEKQIFDHPDVGGKFTICVLFYGPDKYYDMHRRCLEAIVHTVPRERMELRVGSNELNQRSLAMLRDYTDRGIIAKHYRHDTNALKYPVMREMFYDKAYPITTKWVIWFDDDSIADRTPQWLAFLGQQIIQSHRHENAHMFGAKYVWSLQPGQKEWFESRPWHRKRPWRTSNGKPAPNGNRILFATGGWWALTYEAIVACDIPDPALNHNCGDVTIGEQLYQGGFNLKMFNGKKQVVHTSSVGRRGVTTPAPGTPRFVPHQ